MAGLSCCATQIAQALLREAKLPKSVQLTVANTPAVSVSQQPAKINVQTTACTFNVTPKRPKSSSPAKRMLIEDEESSENKFVEMSEEAAKKNEMKDYEVEEFGLGKTICSCNGRPTFLDSPNTNAIAEHLLCAPDTTHKPININSTSNNSVEDQSSHQKVPQQIGIDSKPAATTQVTYSNRSAVSHVSNNQLVSSYTSVTGGKNHSEITEEASLQAKLEQKKAKLPKSVQLTVANTPAVSVSQQPAKINVQTTACTFNVTPKRPKSSSPAKRMLIEDEESSENKFVEMSEEAAKKNEMKDYEVEEFGLGKTICSCNGRPAFLDSFEFMSQ